jgi:hypothetical protein
LVTEQIRDCRERDIDAKRRELEVFKMAFDSFGEKERLELIEGAYRIAECERSILSYKTKALAAVSKDVGIQRLKTQLQLLDKSTSK